MQINKNPTKFLELNNLLEELTEKVSKILDDNFVGVYLQGSIALGAVDMQSDCDFIIFTKHTLTSD